MNDDEGKKKLKKPAELAVIVSAAGCVFLACAWWLVSEIKGFDPTASPDLLVTIAAVTGMYFVKVIADILIGGCFIYSSVAIGLAIVAVRRYVSNQERIRNALALAVIGTILGVVILALSIWLCAY